jgi:hypothetical protein
VREAGAEAALLVECLLAAAEPRPALPALAAEVEPVRFVALARSLAVAESAAHALLGARALDVLGAASGGALRGDAENAAAKNALLVAEAVALQRALSGAGVASVALKGAALVAAHYPAVGARHVGDLDLLVLPADAARAAAVLRDLGCALDREPLPGLDGRPAPAVPAGHHLPPLRTPGGIACELHHAIPGTPGRRADAEGVLDRAREVPWRGGGLRVPSLEDLLGVACTHALGAHRADGRFVPRHVADVAVLVAAGADPGRAERLHPGPEVRESLALVAAARAGDAMRVVAPPRANGVARVVARGRASVTAAAAARRRGELARLLFPARAFLAARYRVGASSPWIPLLWAWRPVRAAIRVLAGR